MLKKRLFPGTRLLAAGLVLAAAASACSNKSVPRFSLASGSVRVGEGPRALFEAPLPGVSGQNYWITVVRAEKPDSDWGAWMYVPQGSRELALPPPDSPGKWEVRLHDLYPKNPHKVLFREALTVLPGATGADVPAPEPPPTAAEPEAAFAAGQPQPASASPLASLRANATTTRFGPPRAEARTSLHVQKAMRDGGQRSVVQAGADSKFLVVLFPDTEKSPGPLEYHDDQVALVLEGGRVLIHPAVVVASAKAADGGTSEPLYFQDEIAYASLAPDRGYPLAIAFSVPAQAGRALLKVADQVVEVEF